MGVQTFSVLTGGIFCLRFSFFWLAVMLFMGQKMLILGPKYMPVIKKIIFGRIFA